VAAAINSRTDARDSANIFTNSFVMTLPPFRKDLATLLQALQPLRWLQRVKSFIPLTCVPLSYTANRVPGVSGRKSGFPGKKRPEKTTGSSEKADGRLRPPGKAPIRIVGVARCGSRAAGALITPALFSQPPPIRREKREKFVGETLVGERFKSFFFPLLSRRAGGEAGREGGRGL